MLSLLGITACSYLPTTTPESRPIIPIAPNRQHLSRLALLHNFHIDGRVGVQTNGQGLSGGIQWLHDTGKDEIDFFSPMGGKIAELRATPDMVVLTRRNGKTYSAEDAESLTEQALGWRMPVNNLTDWALGRPAKSKIEDMQWDERGRLLMLKQDGWEINYQEYREEEGISLPVKLTLRNPKLYLKMVIEDWDISENQAPASPSLPQ